MCWSCSEISLFFLHPPHIYIWYSHSVAPHTVSGFPKFVKSQFDARYLVFGNPIRYNLIPFSYFNKNDIHENPSNVNPCKRHYHVILTWNPTILMLFPFVHRLVPFHHLFSRDVYCLNFSVYTHNFQCAHILRRAAKWNIIEARFFKYTIDKSE